MHNGEPGRPGVRGLPVMCSRSSSSCTAQGHPRLRLPVRRSRSQCLRQPRYDPMPMSVHDLVKDSCWSVGPPGYCCLWFSRNTCTHRTCAVLRLAVCFVGVRGVAGVGGRLAVGVADGWASAVMRWMRVRCSSLIPPSSWTPV